MSGWKHRLTLTDLYRRLSWSWECFTGINAERERSYASRTSPGGSTTGPVLAEATRQYQASLENVRRDPEDTDALEDLYDAKEHMSVLWLRHTTGTTGVPRA